MQEVIEQNDGLTRNFMERRRMLTKEEEDKVKSIFSNFTVALSHDIEKSVISNEIGWWLAKKLLEINEEAAGWRKSYTYTNEELTKVLEIYGP